MLVLSRLDLVISTKFFSTVDRQRAHRAAVLDLVSSRAEPFPDATV